MSYLCMPIHRKTWCILRYIFYHQLNHLHWFIEKISQVTFKNHMKNCSLTRFSSTTMITQLFFNMVAEKSSLCKKKKTGQMSYLWTTNLSFLGPKQKDTYRSNIIKLTGKVYILKLPILKLVEQQSVSKDTNCSNNM